VYAQVFSVLYRVGEIVLVVVIAADIIILFVVKAQLTVELKQYFHSENRLNTIFAGIVCVIVGVIVSKLTALPAGHYDSSLYHAQSIRWIEEYGVVKGLGNLHNRFAYNSAFFCLQALFSFSFLLGKSLHTINGFIAAIFLCYALCSAKVWKNKRVTVSDFLRLGLIAHIISESAVFSSPGSDILSVGLVLYIVCKWVSYQEDRQDKLLPYIELCFLAVWAVSVKLSASAIVFLAIYPGVKLIKCKEWKQIVLYVFIGVGIIVPFLIRNVIISGYLIYPYPELDLFSVDWKMPSYTLLFDRNEITAWGRGLRDVFRFNEPFRVWFPIWYETLGALKKWWWLALISGGILAIKSVYKFVCAIRKCSMTESLIEDALQYILVVFTVIGCILVWFIGSPLPRYGGGYLRILSMFGIGELVVKLCSKLDRSKIGPVCYAFVLGILYAPLGGKTDMHLLRVPDYNNYSYDEVMIEQSSFYVPNGGDQIGYAVFPSTPYRKRLDEIELRGNTLCDGFRMKNEYKDSFVSTYGEVYSDNMFDKDAGR
ncbi:MAG: hypothetical protein K2G03_01125, partial [Bacilli bacterium]|nr:hypothetical protein [Bacilli bacterium]